MLSASPTEMFAALVEDMIDSPRGSPLDAWDATVRKMFGDGYNAVPCNSAALPAERQRFPTLRAAEAACLLGLFEQVCVEHKGSYSAWNKMVQAITHDLLHTKWAFKEIIRRVASQHKWSQAPVLNQWSKAVRGEQPSIHQLPGQVRTQTQQFADYMFNPAKFSNEDITRLRDVCAAPAASAGHTNNREGTDDEWVIIGGLVEGTVACRRMPAFLNNVLQSEERLRLYSTIQAQVEGELIMQLNKSRVVSVSRQSTQAITASILESAEIARIDLPALHLMLRQTKTISYNKVSKSIHFFFYP